MTGKYREIFDEENFYEEIQGIFDREIFDEEIFVGTRRSLEHQNCFIPLTYIPVILPRRARPKKGVLQLRERRLLLL